MSRTLRVWSLVGETLSASSTIGAMIEGVVDAIVPHLFAGASIEARDVESWPRVVVSRGVQAHSETVTFDLAVRGEVYGRIAVAYDPAHNDAIDVEIGADLAMRVALAVHGVHVLAREHRVADTLQRALLPQSLPQCPRIGTSAAYLPGTQEAIVGGDWYDVFELPDGRMAFSVGDVAGHGLHAAVIMGEVRQAFRAAAVNPKSPSLVLERANTIVNMRPDGAIVTAIFGILDPTTATVTYAVAGHPPPILASRGGFALALPTTGIPLGVAESVYTQDWTFTLAPGSLLMLYTDGLTEHSRDVASGEEQLIDAVRAQVVWPSAEPARAIVDRIFEQRVNLDDVATLVLAIDDDTPEAFHFEFSALPFAVAIMRRALAHFLERRGIARDDAYAVLLAVGEAAANAVEHAYARSDAGVVSVRAAFSGQTLVVDVIDRGRWKQHESHEERGRGIRIMRALMDRIEIRTMQAETSVRLTTNLPTMSVPAAAAP